MAESYVSRKEFESLKKEVDEIKKTMSINAEILQKIDKKVDIIDEKISNANEREELKIGPINERIKKVEDNQTWLWRAVGTVLIGIIIKLAFDISKFVN